MNEYTRRSDAERSRSMPGRGVICRLPLWFFTALAMGFVGTVLAAGNTIGTYVNTFLPAGGNAITLSQPQGVALDATGNLYVADTGNCVVWEFPSNGQQPFAVAGMIGKCAGSYASSNPTANSLNHPVDVAVCGNAVFIADSASAATTGIHKVVNGVFSNVNFNFAEAHGVIGYVQPQAITCDSAGDVFMESVYTTLDQNTPVYTLDTVSAAGVSSNIYVEFDQMYQGVAVDSSGHVYTIRGTVGNSRNIATFTPTHQPPANLWNIGIPAQSRSLIGSTRLAIDAQGNFYTTETASNAPGAVPVYVTELSPSSSGANAYSVAYIAGNGTAGFSGDGGAPRSAELNDVNGIAVGSNVYVADTANNRVRAFISAPSTVTATDAIPNLSRITAVNPVTGKLYVALSKGTIVQGGPVNAIVSYSTANDTVIANIPLAAAVSFMAVDPVNDVIYASLQNDTVAVIDGATDTLDATVSVGKSPTGIAIDPGLNLAFVANSNDTFISSIQGPTRNSGAITSPAIAGQSLSGILPQGAIAVDTNNHNVYAVVAGPSDPGVENYTLAVISGTSLSITGTVSYAPNSGATDIAPNSLAVDQRSGLVVIADSADEQVHVYDPNSGNLQAFAENFYPTAVVVDSIQEIAYASTGYGNVVQINLEGGSQSTVNTPSYAATSPQNCGASGTAVAVDQSAAEAYFTTCDSVNGAKLNLWSGAGQTLVTSLPLGSPAGSASVGFALTVDPASHTAYLSNPLPASLDINVINGPSPAPRPLISITPPSFNFGSVALGETSATQDFVVKNSGPVNASLQAATVVGTGFKNPGGSCSAGATIAAGATCNATAAFAPTSNQTIYGGIAFFDNAADTPQLVGLSGTGVGSLTLTITPTTVPAGYAGLLYPTGGYGSTVIFSASNGVGPVTFNLCATLASGKASAVCCPAGGYGSCPAGLLPSGMIFGSPQLFGTPALGTTGSYPFTLVATDSSGNTGSQNYTLVIDPAFTVSLGLASNTVVGGSSVGATITLSEPAPDNADYILINSNDTAVVNSSIVQFNPGQTVGTTTIATNPVTQAEQVSLTAYFDQSSTPVTLLVEPPAGPATLFVTEKVHVSDSAAIIDLAVAEDITVTDSISLAATVPNVVGDLKASADGILRSAGLTIGTVTYVRSTSPAGTVISESPGPTTTETQGEAINLVISSGPPTPAALSIAETVHVSDAVLNLPVPVPNVVGESQGAATATITLAGLTLGRVTQQASSSVSLGNVISQSPAYGGSANRGSAVNLVISSGPPSIVIALAGAPVVTSTASGWSVSLSLQNNGNVTAQTVQETSATLNGMAQSTATMPIKGLAPGATTTLVIDFPASATSGPLPVKGTYSGGSLSGNWSFSIRKVTLP